MTWNEIEVYFKRSVLTSFSKKKLVLTFFTLLLCGLLIVFCKTLALGCSRWIAMGLNFMPILLSSFLLLPLGILLIRIENLEMKNTSFTLSDLIKNSFQSIVSSAYFSFPSILIYSLFWMLLGVLFLLGEIPWVGGFFSIVFSFASFLLIFCSILLCLINFSILFFITPLISKQLPKKEDFLKKMIFIYKDKVFESVVLFGFALIPVCFIYSLLMLSAMLTNFSVAPQKTLAIAFEWFFIMIPFAAILTPAVIFFFNFSYEIYRHRKTCVV